MLVSFGRKSRTRNVFPIAKTTSLDWSNSTSSPPQTVCPSRGEGGVSDDVPDTSFLSSFPSDPTPVSASSKSLSGIMRPGIRLPARWTRHSPMALLTSSSETSERPSREATAQAACMVLIVPLAPSTPISMQTLSMTSSREPSMATESGSASMTRSLSSSEAVVYLSMNPTGSLANARFLRRTSILSSISQRDSVPTAMSNLSSSAG